MGTRLENAKIELSRSEDYDFLVINDDVNVAYDNLEEVN